MSEAKTFRCELMTLQAPVAELDATAAVLPAHDGLVGILPDRAPLVAVLGAGSLVIRQAEDSRYFRIRGGAARMQDNVLTVLTEQCQPLAEPQLRWTGEAPEMMESPRQDPA